MKALKIFTLGLLLSVSSVVFANNTIIYTQNSEAIEELPLPDVAIVIAADTEGDLNGTVEGGAETGRYAASTVEISILGKRNQVVYSQYVSIGQKFTLRTSSLPSGNYKVVSKFNNKKRIVYKFFK